MDNGFQYNILLEIGKEPPVYALKIDSIHYKKGFDNLNEVSEEYKIYNVCWNVVNGDSLRVKWETKFDFIVGNLLILNIVTLR